MDLVDRRIRRPAKQRKHKKRVVLDDKFVHWGPPPSNMNYPPPAWYMPILNNNADQPSAKIHTARGKGGRPRTKDDEMKRLQELGDQRKPWKEIATIMNLETKQAKTADAYRKLYSDRKK